MDLIAHNIVDLHTKLRALIDDLDWDKDYDTWLSKTPDGYIFEIKKLPKEEKKI